MRLRQLATAVAALSLPTLVLLAPPASADDGTTVASGLNNPRHLSFSPTGDLYIAESGTGGDGPCIVGGEGAACFGLTGSVTQVHKGKQSRVLTGLPSVAAEDGSNAAGPADIQVTGVKKYALSIGLGAAPSERSKLPSTGQMLGTLQTGKFGGSMSTLGDLAAYEASADPDGVGPDSNPVGITRYHGGYLVADAGANAVNMVRRHKDVSTVAVFPEVSVQNPFAPPGVMVDMQAVPTSVVVGPDNAIYVSQLTGFPFPVGGSTIWRIKNGSAPTVYATGLTNVTDLAFKGKQLYAVQIAADGLLNGPIGSLVKVDAGSTSPTTVAGGLFAPYGVAIRGGSAYVTVCAVCGGGGSVQAFPL